MAPQAIILGLEATWSTTIPCYLWEMVYFHVLKKYLQVLFASPLSLLSEIFKVNITQWPVPERLSDFSLKFPEQQKCPCVPRRQCRRQDTQTFPA